MPEGWMKMVVIQILVCYGIRYLRNSNSTVASLFPAGMGTTTAQSGGTGASTMVQ